MLPEQRKALTVFYESILDDEIIVKCLTCDKVFLSMKWKQYLPLLRDFTSPTRWYNEVIFHFCDNPQHQIVSNRDRWGINKPYDFSQHLHWQLCNNAVTLGELRQIAIIEKERTKDDVV